MADTLNQDALDYHQFPKPGKLEIRPTKRMGSQRDLALAYSPGVAAACEAIHANPDDAALYTSRGNLVAVISNGTAVLGLGAIGPLAGKPVMEGKAVLFKKFAGVDCFDIEVDTTDIDRFCNAVEVLEPTFGGINLEDIRAPECFEIEKRLRERMKIPVFHDDQHGTAIVVAAAVRNALRLADKNLEDCKLAASGAGAAAIACLNLLVSMGLKRENIVICDRDGVVYEGRGNMDPYKGAFATKSSVRTLSEALVGADIFMGLSAPGVVKAEDVAAMAEKPVILALANPEPEIRPEVVLSVRQDAYIATGRSDYPNQVNNVLCFPFIFRGALDVGATTINEEMKVAAVEAISDIAMREASDEVTSAYGGAVFEYGPEYLIPKPFDPRLMTEIPARVAKAAMDSGVAKRPIEDFKAYHRQLASFIYRSGNVMRPVFEQAKMNPKRVVYAEGESRRVLTAVQQLVDDGICLPILIGRPAVIEAQVKKLGLRFKIGEHVQVVDPAHNPDHDKLTEAYHAANCRRGSPPEFSANMVRSDATAIAATMVKIGLADSMVCGVQGGYIKHVNRVKNIIGLAEGVSDLSAVTMLILQQGTYFLTDTHISEDPTPEHIAETAAMGAATVRRFGMSPKAALLSHSNFGTRHNPFALKMRKAREIIAERYPDLPCDGEMHADTALQEKRRDRIFPGSGFRGEANLLVFPNLDAANITYNTVKVLAEAQPIGPMLVGAAKSAHVLTDAATVRAIVNITAVAVNEAQELS
ncbi:MAG: NADP-dependent malic enzyme [Gammaproteobacteria bacterium]|nr:NADP-dependent malic enzyme [Gammaproteobacteria bacterium]